MAAVRAGRKALELVANDSEVSYLANNERQLAIERLLIRFGEALKSIPNQALMEIDSNIVWAGPKGFRDIASHWYEEGLDHRLIWHALVSDLPRMLDSLQKWIDATSSPPRDSAP
ncbi:MAG TPA: HepT-like ribonuclease domain-containing protein [Steroidobacteraceae bacterium]|jgi:uncharacterized protein with HEPN domain